MKYIRAFECCEIKWKYHTDKALIFFHHTNTTLNTADFHLLQ